MSKNGTDLAKTRNSYVVDFSLRKEVFFVIVGSIIGGITMFIPRFILDVTFGTDIYLIWLVFARVLNSNSYIDGAILHFSVATIIGLVTGIILYKGKILKISKISNSLLFGVISGIAAFVVFYLPVQEFLLEPNMIETLSGINPSLSKAQIREQMESEYLSTIMSSIFSHLIWGITLGLVSTILTREFGAQYRCGLCDVQFSKLQNFERHHKFRHVLPLAKTTKVVILGGGFGGIKVLQEIQKSLESRIDVDIFLVSEDNFFLFTPLLPEMASGLLEPRHISTPVRTFCKRARFFEAEVDSIDLNKNTVSIRRTYDNKTSTLNYDFLVIALGSRNNFFGNKNIEKHSLTIKTLGDAISIRNHIITMLENADQEDDLSTKKKFLTFVVIGGGFSGVETVGEINDLVRESTNFFYRRVDPDQIRIVLVSATDSILPEVGEELGRYAQSYLKQSGVEIMINSKVLDLAEDLVVFEDGNTISSMTVIWAGGVAVDSVIKDLMCQHDPKGRILVDEYLRLKNFSNVYALGDCAAIKDEKSGQFYPPTAQHAIREAKVVAKNLVSSIRNQTKLEIFDYLTKGSMAKIGKRTGVSQILGIKITGFLAWLVWRGYYLSNLPTREKKIRVTLDWLISLFFKADITRLRNLRDKSFFYTKIRSSSFSQKDKF